MFKLKYIKSYRVANRKIKVKWCEEYIDERYNGVCYPDDNLVKVINFGDKDLQTTHLLHEMIHSILNVMGEGRKEKFTHAFAELLTQALLTEK